MINESGSGKINENGDKDLFAVNLTTDNIYDFSVKSYFDGLGTLGKAALRLINADGHLVSSGKYDVTTGRTELSVSVFENGQYFVEVSAIDLPGNTGTYVLDTRDRGAVENTNDDYASDAGTSITVGPGEPLRVKLRLRVIVTGQLFRLRQVKSTSLTYLQMATVLVGPYQTQPCVC